MLDGRTIGVRECTPDNGERKPRAPRQSQPAAEKNSHMTFDEEPKKEEEIKSIRQTYRAKEEETSSVKRSAVDDLLGAREVDMSSAVGV